MSHAALPRRRFLALGGTAVLGLLTGYEASPSKAPAQPFPRTPDEALARLLEGNRRFSDGKAQHPDQSSDRRNALTTKQQPFAVVLGCIDSRVPPEIVLDQGLGDVLVTRSAGQVLDNAVLGSIEYGVEHLGVPLVLVLGHEGCGAVAAAVEVVEGKSSPSGHVANLVAAIRPAVERARSSGGNLPDAAVAENVRLQVTALKQLPELAERLHTGKLQVVGGRYDLDRGLVEVI